MKSIFISIPPSGSFRNCLITNALQASAVMMRMRPAGRCCRCWSLWDSFRHSLHPGSSGMDTHVIKNYN